MQYQRISSSNINFKFESKNFFSIFGLYLFSLGAGISGYSLYLLLEVLGRVDRNIITWNGQGLFWTLILFFLGLFILFIPVEFFSVLRVYNATFKDLILNIIYSIFVSLSFLIIFQYFVSPATLILNDISSIAKAVSFAGFIAIPIILFIQHSLRNKLIFIDKASYGITLNVWMISSQLFI